MKAHLEVGDLATAAGLRVAHVIRKVDGELAYTLCTEITLWSALDASFGNVSRIASPERRMCATCGKRYGAWLRRAVTS